MQNPFFFALLIVLSAVACQSQNDAGASEVLAVADFKTQISAAGIQLVDVRTPQEYEAGYIGEAVNIDFVNDNFATEIQQLDKVKPVYIYCRSGNRSARAAQQMQELGFQEVYDLKGGYLAWSAQR